jgi:hypothetical protein
MESFAPNTIDLSKINGGVRYQNGDLVSPEAINSPIEASAWAQEQAQKAKEVSSSAETMAAAALDKVQGALGTETAFSLLDVYQIGTVFITTSYANPAALFGGFWLRIKDAFLWASGDISSITYTENGVSVTKSLSVGDRGGEVSHTLTIDEMPYHAHGVGYAGGTQYQDNAPYALNHCITYNPSNIIEPSQWVGGNVPNNNMPPYYSVNAWVRVTEEEFNANESL